MADKDLQVPPCLGQMQLLAERALYCPAWNAILAVDLHLGKEATFRHHGLAIPDGATAKTLEALSQLLTKTGANQLWVLGDLFHAETALSDKTCGHFESFLNAHMDTEVILIPGNHDRNHARWPSKWKLTIESPLVVRDRIAMSHFPGERPDHAELLICGHLHPAVRLDAKYDMSGRLPCFWYSDRQLVLPAFGQFTGTALVHPKNHDRIWVALGQHLVEIPPVAKAVV